MFDNSHVLGSHSCPNFSHKVNQGGYRSHAETVQLEAAEDDARCRNSQTITVTFPDIMIFWQHIVNIKLALLRFEPLYLFEMVCGNASIL